MSVFTTFTSMARATGPVLVSSIYRDYGPYASYGLAIAAMSVALVFACVFYKRLVPFGQGPHFKPKEIFKQEMIVQN